MIQIMYNKCVILFCKQERDHLKKKIERLKFLYKFY